MKKYLLLLCSTAIPFTVLATPHVTDKITNNITTSKTVKEQRLILDKNSQGKGFGPQSPRDIDNLQGNNTQLFSIAPPYTKMNLCNIHLHKNAEHKGGEFTQYAGDGDGLGNNSGYQYTGQLSKIELTPLPMKKSSTEKETSHEHSHLTPGDTIEVHYVYSTAQVTPGPTLNSCITESISNPQLRVEAQVFVLVNDKNALNFMTLTKSIEKAGYQQATNQFASNDDLVEYQGSTTGPIYNEVASPYEVTWEVEKKVKKMDISSVNTWFKDNTYQENHAHGVRNLVINPDLLSGE